jgi:hypothetical protein
LSKGCPRQGAEMPLGRGNPSNLIRVVPA